MRVQVNQALDWLFPRACVFCGLASGADACCAGCRDDLPWIERPCRGCGTPLAPAYPTTRCPECAAGTDAVRIVSALVYAYPVDRLIASAKFRQRLDFAGALGEMLGAYLCGLRGQYALARPDLIVPVPLHRRRMAARGFNQAEEIAAPVARRIGVPLRADLLRRGRDTPEQTSLTGPARRPNMAGAFTAPRSLNGMQVAIIDDVWTTGTTARAVARAALSAGAAAVQVWTVARTVGPHPRSRGP